MSQKKIVAKKREIEESVEKYGYVEEIEEIEKTPQELKEEAAKKRTPKTIKLDQPVGIIESGPLDMNKCDVIGEPAEKPGKKFRIQYNQIFLTYAKCQFDWTAHERFLRGVIGKTWDVSKYLASREKHDPDHEGYDEKYPWHMHIIFIITGRSNPHGTFGSTNSRIFDFEIEENGVKRIVHPNIQPIFQKERGWIRTVNYINKENKLKDDKDVTKNMPLALEAQNLDMMYSVWNAKSCGEAMMKNPRVDPRTIECVWRNRTVQFDPSRRTLPKLPWCTQMIDYIKDESIKYDRTVHWIYDYHGGSAKSIFGLYLEQEGLASYFEATGDSSGFAMMIDKELKSGWNGKCLLVDLPRQQDSAHKRGLDSLYYNLERVKNGALSGYKYEGCKPRFAPFAKVIVCANWLPDVGDTGMSRDRWRLFNMEKDKSLRSMTIYEVKQMLIAKGRDFKISKVDIAEMEAMAETSTSNSDILMIEYESTADPTETY